MNRIALSLGPINIYWYSIMILSGALVAFLLINLEAKKRNINKDFITNIIFYAFIFGLVGARVYYVVFNLEYFIDNPSEILQVWNGGLAIHGGIIFGVVTIAVYCKKYKVNPLKILDICAPGVIIAQSIGRWGNFFNQEAHGSVTTITHLKNLYIPDFIIKGMYINGNYYQPTFLYESLWTMLGFIIIILFRKIYKNLKIGQLTGIYLMWYSMGRFIIESLRTDSLMLGPFKIAQIVSIILFIIGIILMFFISKKQKEYKYQESEIKY